MSSEEVPYIGKVLGLIGWCLLIVSIFDFLSLYLAFLNLYQQAMISGKADPRVMAGRISQEIVLQVISSFHYLIALVFISVAAFKYRLATRWFTLSLRIFGVILLLTPIANSLIGWTGWPFCRIFSMGSYPSAPKRESFEDEQSSDVWCSMLGLCIWLLAGLYFLGAFN